MYYCPCPCSDPTDPDLVEESTFLSLPRNLSYVQESYLDAHNVSGRFVHNPRTERRIAANNSNATLSAAAAADAAVVSANDSATTTSLNGDHDFYQPHHYHDHYSHIGNITNGIGCGENRNSITTTTITTTTASSTCSTTDRCWSADGTKVEIEFGKGREFLSDFESRQETRGRGEIGENKGEGERGDRLERVESEEIYNESISNVLSLIKSRRDPNVYSNSASSDLTKSSVVRVQCQKGGEYCGSCVVSASSSSCAGVVCSTESVSLYPTTITSTVVSSLSSSSSSTTVSSSKSSVISPSIPSSSSSKPSFISRVTALLSPKDEDNNVNQHVLDLGSSVDAEPTSYDPDLETYSPGPSQPLLLRSPDRSGLIMDRGEDLITTSSSDHDEHTDSIASTKNRCVSNAISIPRGPESFPDGGQSICIGSSGADSDEEVIMIEYGEDSPSYTDPTDQNNDQQFKNSNVTETNVNTPQSPGSPPESYNEVIGTSQLGDVMSDSDKMLIKTQANEMVSCESPPDDSDAFSEEGVFVNMMEDTDGVNERCVSEVSDDTNFSVDSMFCSPDDIEPAQEQLTDTTATNCDDDNDDERVPKRMSLQEAISKAASDFNKMTMIMYPNEREESESQKETKGDLDKPSTSKSWERSERLKTLSRGSPVHGIPALNVHISSTSDDSSSDSHTCPKQRTTCPKESPIYEDNEFNFNRQGLRKSSSLKTNKTPPGTPHRKKVVRFADAMGLDLESVRHVLNMESPPRIPASAMADLKQGLSEDRVEVGSRYLTACFTQPGATNNFFQTVINQKVRLENAIITDLTITGFIRVANVAFHKSVRVRYTHNNWSTFHDIAACYIKNSCDGPTDRFSFSIVAPAHFVPGNRLEFAVSYNAEGTEFWDNNGGQNYVFECFAKTVPTGNDREWLHFL